MNTDKSLHFALSHSSSEVIAALDSAEIGLSSEEAQRRQIEFGLNVLVEEQQTHPLLDFIANFRNPLVLILLCASIILALLGQGIDSIIIFIIVLMSVFLNYFQERHANLAAQKLKETIRTTATVLRDGKPIEIPIDHITVGDVIQLNAGDLIPADSRIIKAKDFFVNQSSLTGESFPSEKTVEALNATNLSLADITNVAFTGCNVETGSAEAMVFQIGSTTEFGKIAKDLNRPEDSEFHRGINQFSYTIMRLTVFIVLAVFFINALLKHNIIDSFLFSVAVAVGLTPELLPMILSITMAKGSVRMAEKGVIVKKLSAIPNFGSMDILCTDKTGTLTQDKIQLVKYTNVFGDDSTAVLEYVYLNSMYQTGIRNPMDDAVLNYKELDISAYTKVDEIPFDFFRKKMSVVAQRGEDIFLITKGAPEEMFKVAPSYVNNGQTLPIDTDAKQKIRAQYEDLSKQGYRVLALGVRKMPDQKTVYSKDDEQELTLAGFVSFFDPPKVEVKEVLQQIEALGVEIKVITGDNELVTLKICSEVGLAVKGVLLGYQIDSLTDDALRVVVENTTIFARFSPDEKNRIILALKHNNHVVGYMGDGINDAPSLKTADVGISVNNAVDVAKESASIILTHKSLNELMNGIQEGRKTFGNTMKYIMMGISSNFGNMFSVIGAVIFLPFFPMLPIQILLNNLIYDVSQITLPTDDVDIEFTQSPKRWNQHFIKNFMYLFGPLSSCFDFLTFYVLYGVFHANAATFQTGWFLESLATQTLVIHVIRTRRIPFFQSTANRAVLLSTLGCVTLGWLIPFSPLGKYFSFVPVSITMLFAIVSIVGIYLCLVEVAKRYFYRHNAL